jgi:DNA-binding ferritin-like protein
MKTFVKELFTFQLQLKLYHWQTYYYSRHKAMDKLMDSLLDFIDTFIESFMGKYGRVEVPQTIQLNQNITDKNAITQLINPFLCILKRMKTEFKKDDELLNLIEEIEAKVNQTKYLMTLK